LFAHFLLPLLLIFIIIVVADVVSFLVASLLIGSGSYVVLSGSGAGASSVGLFQAHLPVVLNLLDAESSATLAGQ